MAHLLLSSPPGRLPRCDILEEVTSLNFSLIEVPARYCWVVGDLKCSDLLLFPLRRSRGRPPSGHNSGWSFFHFVTTVSADRPGTLF